jgi:transposase
VWWSRAAQPDLRHWAADGRAARQVEPVIATDDPDPKALACYGLLVRTPADPSAAEQMLLRFADGRPLSAVTIAYLEWCCAQLAASGIEVLVLIWDNAPWHVSRAVRTFLRAHNQQVKQAGRGVRILACYLPVNSPWLNAIEPKWAHGKRRIADPAGKLSLDALADRVCHAFNCPPEPPLPIPEKVA